VAITLVRLQKSQTLPWIKLMFIVNVENLLVSAYCSRARDLSLAGALAQHISFVYEQTGRNQRRTAKVLRIWRATLVRRL
jgi:ActR/RegA family two-component response regulator